MLSPVAIATRATLSSCSPLPQTHSEYIHKYSEWYADIHRDALAHNVLIILDEAVPVSDSAFGVNKKNYRPYVVDLIEDGDFREL